MGLSKDDVQRIKGALQPAFEGLRTEIKASETRVISEMERQFMAQNKSMTQGFADLKAVMENTYVSREEFEQVKEELQNEVDDLKKQVQALQKRMHTPA